VGVLDDYLMTVTQQNQPAKMFNEEKEHRYETWRTGLIEELRQALGGFPAEPADLNPTVFEEDRCEGYTRYRVEYTIESGLRCPAYVLVPDHRRANYPAVVACHGHGYGSKDIVGLTPEGKNKEGDPGYQKNFAVELARRGMLVIAPEWVGFGDMRFDKDKETKPGQSSCNRLSGSLLLMGRTTLGLRILQLQRTLDYLETRADADSRRIGIYGISGGGTISAFGSILDERIRAVVISGYANTFGGSILQVPHCICNFVPGLYNHADMPDYIGLIAPRPLLIESATEDKIFPIDTSRRSVERIREIYRAAGSEGQVEHDIFVGKHEISGRIAYDWLVRQLGA
jgi:dienelactone hydrolase